jgi:hypothetical protein
MLIADFGRPVPRLRCLGDEQSIAPIAHPSAVSKRGLHYFWVDRPM